MLNYLTQVTVFVGGVEGYAFADPVAGAPTLLLSFATGNFIYIASPDLIPEIKDERSLRRSFSYFAVVLLGVLLMLNIKLGRGWVA